MNWTTDYTICYACQAFVMLTLHIITLFPESFDSYITSSIVGRAIKNKKIKIKFYNPRDFVRAKNKSGYKQVDDKPYGGGPGMVLMAEPILKAVKKALASPSRLARTKVILFSPRGRQFDNRLAGSWAKKFKHLVLICGRYEGTDERVQQALKAQTVSVGPYVLTGGELAAMVVLDTMARQIEGVLGRFDSLEEKRLAAAEVYTRPETFKYKGRTYRVPKVLLSGHHRRIEAWKERRG